jgi:hypothetical protein
MGWEKKAVTISQTIIRFDGRTAVTAESQQAQQMISDR